MAKRIQFKANWLDRALIAVAPERAQRRIVARAQINFALGSSYSGAAKNRNATKNWVTTNADADSDLLPELQTLRDRSSDLVRNNPLAAGAINTKVTNIVGKGLRVQSQIDFEYLGMSADEGAAWQKKAEREFKLFSESAECDIERTYTFRLLQDLVLRSTFEKGDCFVAMPFVERDQFPFGTKLQVIEADRVSNPDYEADTETLAGGVEKDQWGAPVKYHISKAHPGDHKSQSAGVWYSLDAFGEGRRNVLHVYKKLRPGQTRGVPDLAPVIEAFKQLGQYTEAELTAAVISGMFTVFIKTENGEGLAGVSTGPQQADQEVELGYGSIVGLAENESVDTANPGRPNVAFDPFVLAILRQIGVALELPYEIMIKHFTASYSASRAALLEAWRMFKSRRVWFSEMFCQPVYETVITEAVLSGRLDAPGFVEDYSIRKAYLSAIWTGDAPGQLDPLKETRAAAERVAEDFSTRAVESAELTGTDWDQNVAQRGREERRRKAEGLLPVDTGSETDHQEQEVEQDDEEQQ